MHIKLLSPLRIRFCCLLIALFLIGCTLILMVLGMIPPAKLVAPSVEQPVVAEHSNILIAGISQVVSDDENLYVLFGKYSIVGVYTHSGEYLYSIGVYNHTNGRTEIAAQDGYLYICDKVHNVYTFREGKLASFTDRVESLTLRQQLPFGSSDADYDTHTGSIWYAPDGERLQCVIERPGWLCIYQNDFLHVFLIFLFAVVGHLTFMPSLRKNTY